MKLRTLIVLFIALPFVIYGKMTPKIFSHEVAVLNQYAKNGTTIADHALILTENGFLGESNLGFVYKGQLAEDERPVAIKFIREHLHYGGLNELEIFDHMQAINNPEVEKLGIPSVYFDGKWENFIVIAITELDESLDNIRETKTISPLEIMILLRNFVIQSKYMHKHGVRNFFINSNSIMFRLNQSFIIDFRHAEIMEEVYAMQQTRDDWIAFTSTILDLFGIKIEGLWVDFVKEDLPNLIEDDVLLSVIKKFGNEAYSSNRKKHFPKYDRLEKFINQKIKERRTERVPICPRLSK